MNALSYSESLEPVISLRSVGSPVPCLLNEADSIKYNPFCGLILVNWLVAVAIALSAITNELFPVSTLTTVDSPEISPDDTIIIPGLISLIPKYPATAAILVTLGDPLV